MTDNHHDHPAHDNEHIQQHGLPADRRTLLGPSTSELAECPVMKGSIVVKADAEAAGLYRDYEGNRYWLCCAGCGPTFDADPARYAAA